MNPRVDRHPSDEELNEAIALKGSATTTATKPTLEDRLYGPMPPRKPVGAPRRRLGSPTMTTYPEGVHE